MEVKSAFKVLRDDGVPNRQIRGSLFFVRDSTVLPPEGPRVPNLGTRHPRTFPAWRSGREGKVRPRNVRNSKFESGNSKRRGIAWFEPITIHDSPLTIYHSLLPHPPHENGAAPFREPRRPSCEQTQEMIRRGPAEGPWIPLPSECGLPASGKRHAGACRPCAGRC